MVGTRSLLSGAHSRDPLALPTLRFPIQISNSKDRHCEERSDEAIQSPVNDSGLLRFARNDGNIRSRSRGTISPELLQIRRLTPETEGAGNAGCTLHPRSRVPNCTNRRTRA